jgi:hypothetical protein
MEGEIVKGLDRTNEFLHTTFTDLEVIFTNKVLLKYS